MREVQLLHQWLSPGFPTGAFAWSHGLDRLIDDGEVGTALQLQAWLEGVLRHGGGRSDAVLAAAVLRKPEDWCTAAELAAALAPSRERHAETMDQGTSFARAVGLEPAAYPIVFARAAAREGIAGDLALTLYLQAMVANLVSAAIRAVPLGQTDGQAVASALHPLCAEIASAALAASLDEVGTCTIRADMASLHHETQYSRMFRS
ncbi:urease accessory protein UreF [Roseobacter sp. HKCCA0434]|uniref:urease accessory protein UreF n=1 Tax=Roseobacter sp. HKCCA0434 TaxID=3079297 RepID=UPI002905B824|nr:urease accessory UreF family protein [Roseobacter sp. HKCCA0434]